jgi:hypothetical protein
MEGVRNLYCSAVLFATSFTLGTTIMVEDQRRYYRFTYPVNERPILNFANESYEVLKIAESNLEILTKHKSPDEDYIFQGEIVYSDGCSDSVSGTVLKKGDNHTIIALIERLSFKRLMSEQSRIRLNYPDFDFGRW